VKPYHVPVHIEKREGKLSVTDLEALAGSIDVTGEAIMNGLRADLDASSRLVACGALEIETRPGVGPAIRDVFATISRLAHARLSVKATAEFARDFVAELARVQASLVPAVVNDIRIDREPIDIEIDDPDMAEQYSVLVAKSSPRKGEGGRLLVPSEVQGIRVGPAYIICLPSEPINEIGMRLKMLVKEQAGQGIEHVFLFQLCNDGFGYIVTPFEHEANGYEVSIFCFGKRNGTIVEEESIKLASRVLGKRIEWKDVPLPAFRQAPWPEARQKAKDEWMQVRK
jgi:hypothetical protein